jgi:fumarate reductase subunit C
MAIFVAIFSLILLWGIGAVAGGEQAYQAFLAQISSPGMVTLLWITTIAIFYHAIAWFKVTPKAMPIQKGEEFLPGSLIAGAHYVVWIVLTLIVLAFAGVF